MKKILKKSFIVMILVFTLAFEPCGVLASETGNERETGTTDQEYYNDTLEQQENEPEAEEPEEEPEGEEELDTETVKSSMEETARQVISVWNTPRVLLKDINFVDKGSRIEAKAVYESNDPDVKFRWLQYNLQTKEWSELTEWQDENEITWYPPAVGNYWLCVEARLANGIIVSKTKDCYYGGIRAELSAMCVVDKDDHFEMGVVYDTNDPDIQFRWQYYDMSEKEWHVISDWKSGNWTSWKAPHTGDFMFYVEAKVSDGRILSKSCSKQVKGACIASFTTSIPSPGWMESTVIIQGKYKDPIGEVGYARYLVYDGKDWKALPYKSDGVEWSPKALGKYWFCYQIYDKSGALIEQSIKEFSVETPYVNVNDIGLNKTGELSYTISALVDTNDSAIEYKWLYYNVSTGQWHVISDWSQNRSISWTAPSTGNYWIHVETRLHDGTTASKTIAYTVQMYPADLSAMMLYANNYSSTTPYIIMVNRAACKVGIFRGWRGNWTPVYYWDCSPGKASTPTVSGVFRVGSRGYYFDSYGSRCFWWTQFYGNYLFHSVLYYPNGSLMDGRVGVALSHGCVRLQINNAKWIYDNIPSGTTVVVY